MVSLDYLHHIGYQPLPLEQVPVNVPLHPQVWQCRIEIAADGLARGEIQVQSHPKNRRRPMLYFRKSSPSSPGYYPAAKQCYPRPK
jgi:hypothetical protein